jgi:hypothetical protein
LQRIGYILENTEVIEEEHIQNIAALLSSHVKNSKLNYLPLAPEIAKTGYPRCKK